MAKKYSIDLKQKFVELRAEGRPYSEISLMLNISKPTLIEWSRDLEDDISNLKAIHMDELFSKFYVAKMIRIELMGNRLEAIINELNKRDLTDISTDRLLAYLLKYSCQLREEETAIVFKGDTFQKDFLNINMGTWDA